MMISIFYSSFSLIVGIQSNSVCGYKIANCLLKINNEIYSKPSHTNTLYSPKLTCIDTMDYTISDKEFNLFDLRDCLERFHSGYSFQKPIYNYNINEIDDFETISNTDNLILYGPHVNMVHDMCNFTVYIDIDAGLQQEYLNNEAVDCNFNPDFIIGINSNYVTFLQQGDYINSILENYPAEVYKYKNYNGIKIDKFNKFLLPMFFKTYNVHGIFGIINILTSLKLKEIIF